ncbi:helicase-like protein [Leishmania infantum JPCM5]|uniref:Helicase-like protein n=2 Tax=Leishmania infantum TaxID=5671 RepID=A4I3N9_LEIIN|nr:helicase-like protein [Leishmania infantum JPCM5]CAM69394.1 helicase-like protein [Leishmania infantum JPCM5]|eukprot:XP_001470201.1 helicase-like protein [Leishmania infantum JPCM5]
MPDRLKGILLHRECEDELEHQQARQHSSGTSMHSATPLATAVEKCSDTVQVATDDSLPPAVVLASGASRSSASTTSIKQSTGALTYSVATPLNQARLGHLTHAGSTAVHTCSSKHHYRTRLPRLRSTAAVSVNAESSLSKTAAAVSADAQRSNPTATPAPTMPEGTSASPLAASPLTSSAALPPPSSPPLADSATLALPFTPYPVQQEMIRMIADVLHSASPHVVPVAVVEVPTGCGKTMALLSSVLRYQQELKRKSPKELDAYLRQRRPSGERRKAPPKGRRGQRGPRQRGAARLAPVAGGDIDANEGDTDDECTDGWSVPPSFFKHFRVNSQRKIRAELDVAGSQELRRRFLPPPCTVYYVTRTHAQLRQAVRELRRLHGATSAIRMNILGSRERYCIHPKVMASKANHTLPVQGNNLGEVCDKLVSLGLCEMVDKYDELSCSAITGPVGHQRGQIWDMEDLVLEGTSRHMCPYYAARDLVFYADVNFCTYPYLLDPLIRHETKMEAALKNNAVVVFDEAHNVAAVCQDALSLECPRAVLALILSELEPLVSNQVPLARQPLSAASSTAGVAQDDFAAMQYPRELHLGAFTLVEIFSFLCTLFQSLSVFFDVAMEAADDRERRGKKRHRGDEKGEGDEHNGRDCGAAYMQGTQLEHHLRRDMEAHVAAYRQRTAAQRHFAAPAPALASLELFQRAYGVIMALGVTFNPFLFSVFGLSTLKRWLLLLRFLLQKPQSFAVAVRSAPSWDGLAQSGSDTERSLFGARSAAAAVAEAHPAAGGDSGAARTHAVVAQWTIDLRCLDGSLAFSYLLKTVHRVVLASGTLSPFPQLARDLGVEASLWRTLEGLHVVPPTQYSLTALTALPVSSSSTHDGTTTQPLLLPLRCTHASLSNPVFLKTVARAVVQLTQTLRESSGGGVLLFVPNYAVLTALAKLTREVLLVAQREQQHQSPHAAAPTQLFLEPRKAEALTEVLCQFQNCTQAPRCGTALLFSVYRGKVSEGLDFTDDMARLVLCLGLPLQPLKSWKVIAQRAYSGSDWYTTDAVRAVNQALGRCLRHMKDYGAVVLLDERYAQPEYQERLSKWCRATLQTESSLPQLCAGLRTSFMQWRRAFGALAMSTSPLPTPSAAADRAVPWDDIGGVAHQDAASLARTRLGTEQLPFTRVLRAPSAAWWPHRTVGPALDATASDSSPQRSGAARLARTVPGAGAGARQSATAGAGLPHSPLACTAVKLLYETAAATGDVSRQVLQDAIQSLTKNFFDSSGSGEEEGEDAFE